MGDTFFWVGTEGTPKSPGDESKTAILAHPFEGTHYEYRNADAPILGAARNEDVMLSLPPHMKVGDLKWLAVWDRRFSVDFDSLIFDVDSIASSTTYTTTTTTATTTTTTYTTTTSATTPTYTTTTTNFY